jgi:flagellar hook protein FlgE
MMRSMYSGISGIRAHQIKMDVVANNIANVNTVGYKASRVTFQEVLNQTIQPAFASDGSSIGGINAQQIGLGVSVGAIDVMHIPSGVQRTDRAFDVSISGDGFFMVTDGTDEFFTRAGNFYMDESGALVTHSGHRVCNEYGDPIEFDPAEYTDLSIDKGGNIKGIDSGGNVEIIDTLGIAKFTNPQGLVKEGNNLFRETPNCGDREVGIPGEPGFSTLIPSSLEMSSVDLSQEFTDMIIAQRGFQANARVITTSNDLLQELAGIIR